jgi:DNA-binding PadR family transcriptional regulator
MSDINGQREITEDEEQRFEAAYHLLEDLRAQGIAFGLVEEEVRFRPASRISEAGKAEMQHYKAEIYELLREEEEVARAREARLAAQPETDPKPEEEWVDFEELTSEEQRVLFAWIAETLEAAPLLERYRHDSYQLKHIFARAPEGFYVTDAQFRSAMWTQGYLGRRYPGRRYQDLESRYYYVRASCEGLVEKLARVGVPQEWSRDAIKPSVERRPGAAGKEL